MTRKRLSLALVALLVIGAGAGVVAAATESSSYNTTESELLNGTRTNMPVTGSGDDAVVTYEKPDVSESTNAEFQNGSLSGPLSIGSDLLQYDGLVVGSQHDSASELSSGSLTNLTAKGSGDAGYLQLSSADFSDGFEDEPADSGTPDAWEQVSTGIEESVVTSHVYAGSQAYNLTASSYSTTRPAEQPYGTAKTADISTAIYQKSGDRSALYLLEDGQTIVFVGMRNGDLQYYDGSWNTISTTPDKGEYVDVTLTDIDPGNDTIDVKWSTASASGSQADITLQNPMSNGYTEVRVQVKGTGIFDEYRIGGGVPESAQYVSTNHSVSNAEEAAVNVTAASNTSATLRVEYWDGSAWTTGNKTTVTTAANHTISLPSVDSSTWRLNVSVDKTGSNPSFELADESILSSKQATYTTQTYNLSDVQGASIQTGLPNSTVTIDWQASADGSTWVTQDTTTHSSSGTHTPSFSGDYQYWRAEMTWTYDGGDGSGNLDSLTWDAATAGTYTGQNHTVVNASHAFIAITNKDATANVTIRGYDKSTGSWETAGNKKYNSSAFESIALDGNYSKYQTKLRVTTTGTPTVELHSEGVAEGTTIVQKATTSTDSDGVTLASAVSEPKAASNSLLSELPLDLLPEYLSADFKATIDAWFQRLFGGGTSSANVQEEASQLESTYNENSGDFTSWANAQTAGQDFNHSAYDTIKIRMQVNDENATRYLIALVDGDRFATTTVVNETDRTVDETLVLKGKAAVDADSILETIHEDYVLEDRAISREYQTRLSGRYGDQFGGTLINASA